MEENEKGGGVHIQAGGSVGYAEGKGAIAAGRDIRGDVSMQNIDYGTIQLDKQYLNNKHKKYADSLQEFIERVNRQLQAEKVPSGKVAPVQDNLNAAAKELQSVKPDEELPTSKEYSIGGKFSAAIEGLIDISPDIAETVASCIPILSIFSRVVGKGVEKIVERYRNSKKQ